MKQYITYCKTKWQMEDAADEREKAFLGLIWMLEGFMEGRQYAYVAKAYHTEHERMSVRLKNMWQAEQEEAAKKSRPTDSIATPPMLPSPASIATTSSANSTPTNHSTGAPAATKTQNESKTSRPGEDEKEKLPPPHLTVPVNANFVYNRQSQSAAIVNASRCMGYSQRTLTLPILAKHFPRTFARMIYTTYSITDEHEADIEDEEGELFWPGQLATGEGIGWVCLMGKAMIKEFGKDLGYRGYEGVIPKDEAAPAQEDVADPSSGPSSSTPVPFS
ncbi:hypothetical protein EW026_g6046 [Hermanssonia centrifuga]|uniref:Uncharacterized protein n=1 Tax=Hermanssonia centrifuga TaxID=98765 RepID=A0A4V6S0W0_9APHY|nr:hypothetical protein EW026_g6046 [Hermanssonia centrifuga]